ncbi:MAG: histidinol-phosphate transaminase [Spirulinaceae cyanobacterium RM2_2_10]|nr:histidinol-phosphate transaminase [Spirulinaceae cyanobacterium SM2_1_0]NJO18903.1 histidinol-phosphate transaminase [Spirulinaceae cyanobacterium RM2_2_10]
MFEFLRPDLAQLHAYTPQPGGAVTVALDHLDANENPYDLPAALKEKLAWHYQQALHTHRYPDGSHAALKTAIAHYVSEAAGLATAVTPAQISVGNGSDELIRSLLFATCLNGRGAILVAAPTFSMYAILAQTLGIAVKTIGRHETDWQMDLTAAAQAIAQSQPPVRAVFVVHPNSPTGNALSATEIDWLRALPPEILVVIDEAYYEFSQQTLLAELAERPNWVITRTFSKAFRLAAHRVGYAIAHPDLAAALEKVRLPYNLPSFSQAAALLALEQRQALLAVVPEILGERDRLYTALSALPRLRVWSSQSNFLYARLADAADGDHLTLMQTLKARGTLIRATGGGLRLTIGTPAENERMVARLQAVL